jgi:hypothetical protein
MNSVHRALAQTTVAALKVAAGLEEECQALAESTSVVTPPLD